MITICVVLSRCTQHNMNTQRMYNNPLTVEKEGRIALFKGERKKDCMREIGRIQQGRLVESKLHEEGLRT